MEKKEKDAAKEEAEEVKSEEKASEENEAKEVKKDAEASKKAEAEEAEATEPSDEETEKEKDEEREEAASEKKDDKKLFKKKKDKRDERIADLEDKVKRQLAEFENFRNRTDKEKSAMFENGAKSVIEKILPVIDNFERGLESIPEEEKGSPFADGMNMIYKQLVTELENMGVKPIEAVGKEFDPNLHNAVMQVESDEYESGIVAAEMQKGYMYHDAVLRFAMVSVVT